MGVERAMRAAMIEPLTDERGHQTRAARSRNRRSGAEAMDPLDLTLGTGRNGRQALAPALPAVSARPTHMMTHAVGLDEVAGRLAVLFRGLGGGASGRDPGGRRRGVRPPSRLPAPARDRGRNRAAHQLRRRRAAPAGASRRLPRPRGQCRALSLARRTGRPRARAGRGRRPAATRPRDPARARWR